MRDLIILFFKGVKLIVFHVSIKISWLYCKSLFFTKQIKHHGFTCFGFPYFHKSRGAYITIGNKFHMNNGFRYSDSGLNGKCRIEVRDDAKLVIGNNVGLSDVTITCHESIKIGNNVLLGVGVQLRDTDNHSLNSQDWLLGLDWQNKKTAPIIIDNNVFIGTNSIILKGVQIGRNSIIAAGSVVTRNVPEYEIWGGNPARFIKKNILSGN